MKKSNIEVGKTYRNKGAGLTTRKVLGIGTQYRPLSVFSHGNPPSEPGVLYEKPNGEKHKLFLGSFASWAGSVVEDSDNATD